MKHVVSEPETAGAVVWIESFSKAQEWNKTRSNETDARWTAMPWTLAHDKEIFMRKLENEIKKKLSQMKQGTN